MNGRILITGATGTVGRAVMADLMRRGAPLVAAIGPDNDGQGLPEGVARAVLDFGRPETYGPALDGADRLFLIRPARIADAFPLIDAARSAGVVQVVFISPMGAHRRTSHWQVEQALLTCGMAYTFLRSSFFMQNLDAFCGDDIRGRDEIFVPAGGAATSFVDVRDVGAAAGLVLAEPGHLNKTYTLTGSQALTYEEVAGIFSRVQGRPIAYAHPTPAAYEQRLRDLGVADDVVQARLGLYTMVRLGLNAAVIPDLAELLARPPITLEQFALDFAPRFAPADSAARAASLRRFGVPAGAAAPERPLPVRLVGSALRTMAERRVAGQDLAGLAQQLRASGERIAGIIERGADNPGNQGQAAHIVGIERWSARRLAVLLGEPLVIDEYDAYRPDAALPMADLAAQFRAARGETLATIERLAGAGVSPTATVPHNDLGALSAVGWLSYLDGHALLEVRRITSAKRP